MKKVIAVVGLLLMLGCSPGFTSTAESPGDEATSQTSPAQEASTQPSDGADSGDDGGGDSKEVSVDLPGLPIGGSGAVFSPDARTQCVDVSWTGSTFPEGVGLKFDIKVPQDFDVNPSPCTDAPCVKSGFRITAEAVGCTVSITWKGEPVDVDTSYALRADAKAFCTSQKACAEMKAAAKAANEQTGGKSVQLTVFATVAGGSSGGSSPSGDSSSGGSSPSGDSSSEGSSPSAGSSGG